MGISLVSERRHGSNKLIKKVKEAKCLLSEICEEIEDMCDEFVERDDYDDEYGERRGSGRSRR